MTQRPRYPKSSRIVPFCPRKTTVMAGEWICADHWRLVDRDLKAVKTRLVLRWKKRGRWVHGPRGKACDRALDGWWRRIKRQAIQRAAGASA